MDVSRNHHFHIPPGHYLSNSHVVLGLVIKGLPMVMVEGDGPCYPRLHMTDKGVGLMPPLHPCTAIICNDDSYQRPLGKYYVVDNTQHR
jgi:hypothetical protein